MTDREALDFLVEKMGTATVVAGALGVSLQRLTNWYERGISHNKRGKVWAMVNDHGAYLPREWLWLTTERAA